MTENLRTVLLARAQSAVEQDRIVTADEVVVWPEGLLVELLSSGTLISISPSNSVVCDACIEGHAEQVQVVEEPPGSTPRHYIGCPENGRVKIDPTRMRRWKVVGEGDSEHAVPKPAARDMRIPGVFDYADDYTWVRLNDYESMLRGRQCDVFEILLEAYRSGRPDVPWGRIAARLRTPQTSRMSQIFRARPGWQKFIAQPERGVYRLNLPH